MKLMRTIGLTAALLAVAVATLAPVVTRAQQEEMPRQGFFDVRSANTRLNAGVHELEARVDIPYKVVINEGVNLAKRFGSTDGHKYINACLDLAAQSLRKTEVKASTGG